jgi:hypothetical protein
MSQNKFVNGWVLQNNATVTLSDYQRRALAEEYANIALKNKVANLDVQREYKKTFIYELSLKDLGANWVRTMATVSQEIYQWLALPPKQRTLQYLMEIIGKDDRMIYVGITLVFASLFIYFMIMP